MANDWVNNALSSKNPFGCFVCGKKTGKLYMFGDLIAHKKCGQKWFNRYMPWPPPKIKKGEDWLSI